MRGICTLVKIVCINRALPFLFLSFSLFSVLLAPDNHTHTKLHTLYTQVFKHNHTYTLHKVCIYTTHVPRERHVCDSPRTPSLTESYIKKSAPCIHLCRHVLCYPKWERRSCPVLSLSVHLVSPLTRCASRQPLDGPFLLPSHTSNCCYYLLQPSVIEKTHSLASSPLSCVFWLSVVFIV